MNVNFYEDAIPPQSSMMILLFSVLTLPSIKDKKVFTKSLDSLFANKLWRTHCYFLNIYFVFILQKQGNVVELGSCFDVNLYCRINSRSKREGGRGGCKEVAIWDLCFYLHVKYFRCASPHSYLCHVLPLLEREYWKSSQFSSLIKFTWKGWTFCNLWMTRTRGGNLNIHISLSIFPLALKFSFDDSVHEVG